MVYLSCLQFAIIPICKRVWPINPLHPSVGWKFGWYWPEIFFINFQLLDIFYIIIFCFRKTVLLPYWRNINSLYPRMLCAKFSWNWPSGSGEEEKTMKVYYNNRQLSWVFCSTEQTGMRHGERERGGQRTNLMISHAPIQIFLNYTVNGALVLFLNC